MTVTIADQIKAVKREIGMRRRVYPKWVADKRYTQAKADEEIAAMEGVLASLESIALTARTMPLDQTALRKAVSFELAEIICGAVPAQGAMQL